MARLALVTGASSGIGRACAAHLAGLGYRVLAGVRREADAPDYAGVDPLLLDVTSDAHIEAAAERVGPELAALVNNAGIAVNGPVETVAVEDWRRSLEVNLVGQVAVTRALLPAILRARGRVVNMSSIGGRVSGPLFGPYAASKFALEAMNDSLRREVAPHGVHVVCVEPGGIATPIWEKGLSRVPELLPQMSEDARGRYDGMIAAVLREAERLPSEGLPPEAVAAVVGRALTARRPRTRYVVGREARIQATLARLLPDRAFDALIARRLYFRR
jgi:NAD(P)-dependent dehydrogenase (short-subunit alcohol dehydrogenase family)